MAAEWDKELLNFARTLKPNVEYIAKGKAALNKVIHNSLTLTNNSALFPVFNTHIMP